MSSRRFKITFLTFLLIFTIGNTFFINYGFAFVYSYQSTIPVWSHSTGNQFMSAVAISSDGKYIIGSCEDSVSHIEMRPHGKLFLFNNSDHNKKNLLWNYSILNGFNSLAISKNGSNFIAGGGFFSEKSYIFKNYNKTPEMIYNINGKNYDVELSEDGNIFAIAAGDQYKAFMLNDTNSFSVSQFPVSGLALRVALSTNGRYMAVTDKRGSLFYFKTSKTTPEWIFDSPEDSFAYLSMSSDGKYIVVGNDNVYLLTENNSIPEWIFEELGLVNSIKISENGKYLAVGSDKIYFFGCNSSIPEWTYSINGEIEAVDLSNDGDFIIALDTNSWLYLFNRTSSKPIWRYRLDGYPTASYDYSLEISSDGKYIVAGGRHYLYLFDRDIVIPPKLIISGYSLFHILGVIIILVIISIMILFIKIHKISNKNKRFN
ncbi:MAG: WD40 repeat domain-containing protein [Promethearchaeota archaeon]|nr:MAG: WD40 repeat domain-containing protein [Candidatus Lokiarchaeota archaeon]